MVRTQEHRQVDTVLQTVLESIGEEFYALDAQWRIIYVNQRGEQAWRRSREEMIGRVVWDVFPESIGTPFYHAQQEAMRERRAVHIEAISPVRNRWVEGNIYPTEDGGISLYIRDCHDRKIAQETLRSSEERYRRLLDTALEGVLFLNATAVISHVNQRLAEMLGHDSPDELIGKEVFSLFFPEDENQARNKWTERMEGVQEEYELRLRRKNGSECWVIAHVSVERDPQSGVILGTFTMLTDITERRQALKALESKSEEVASILESITDAFFAVDQEWRFTYVNAEAERVLLLRKKLIGRNIWKAFPTVLGTEFEKQYRRAVQDQTTVSFQAYYPPPLDCWFDVHAYPSPTGAGLSVYFRNINEERRREADRERLLKEQARLVAALQEAGVRQRRFLREMLFGFTEGRLRLCDSSVDLPRQLPPLSEPIALTPPTIRRLRKQLAADAEILRLPLERLHDFETAVGEAAMNAVQHGGGGTGRVHGDTVSGMMQVWIEDKGDGIAEDFIHRAIEQGWTTGGFGQGFFLMRSCADRIYLLTGTTGTTVVLEQEQTPPEPVWLK